MIVKFGPEETNMDGLTNTKTVRDFILIYQHERLRTRFLPLSFRFRSNQFVSNMIGNPMILPCVSFAGIAWNTKYQCFQ
jgi:hypothetical protein